jgi:hypothetical protein
MNRPIIVIHQGNPDYLRLCLLKAREINPQSPLVLLGDQNNAGLVNVVPKLQHELINMSGDAQKFKTIYVHRSEYRYEFELICFQRWFVLRDFMKKRGFHSCLHLDSDVLLFSDISESGKRFDQYAMSLAHWGNPEKMGHTNFINGIETLQEFCDFMLKLYTSKEYAEQLDLHFLNNKWKPVSDMTALGMFYDLCPTRIADICDIQDDSMFDDRITFVPDGFEKASRLLKKVMKSIYFTSLRDQQGIPFYRHKNYPQGVRLLSLHFHGGTKYMMKHFFNGCPCCRKLFFDRLMRKLKFRTAN